MPLKTTVYVRRKGTSCTPGFLHKLFFLLLAFGGLAAQESWPLNGDWIPMLTSDWTNAADAIDGGPSPTDFVTDNDGIAAYYYATSSSLFFRMVLYGTPLQNPGNLRPYAWSVALDMNMDGYLDWLVLLGGKQEILWTYPNVNGYPDNIADLNANFSISNPITNSYVRTVSAASANFPNATYLDIQVPFTALQMAAYPRNIYYESTIALVYGSNTNEDANTNTDLVGTATTFAEALASVVNYTPSMPDSYGNIYDTRDPAPNSNAGIWYRNETLTVSGSGWPASTSIYYNSGQRNVTIINSESSLLWSGVLTTDAFGTFSNYSLTTIPLSAMPDIYTFLVEDPRHPGIYNAYDSFEIKAPLISVQKSTSDSLVNAGSTVHYSIVIQNGGNVDAALSTITDLLPEFFTYVPGSSSGLTTADPQISGQQLNWIGTWSVPAGGTLTLNFKAKAYQRGTHYNNVTISGGNFGVTLSGPSAPVTVSGPSLSLAKIVDRMSAQPGDTLSYTVHYSNTGDGDATSVIILENIPVNTTYVPSSASGADMTILYSHNGGISFDADPSAPVTNLSFQRSLSLAPGENATLTFKVIVK